MKTKVLFSVAFLLAINAVRLIAQDDPVYPTLISHGTFWGETPPLSSLPVLSEADWEALNEKFKKKELNKKTGERLYPYQSTALPMGPDEAWQMEMGTKGTLGTILNFAGQGSNSYPTDPNGDVNQTHYFQTINTIYSIYTKAGALVAGPTNINLLFGSVPGSSCNDGDPIVLWDEAAGRWLVAEFSLCTTNDRMLVAISTTSNPTGTWYQYSFDVADVPDYEKFGVWRDAYYMGTNTGSGTDIYAFQRDVMLVGGASPTMVAFDNAWRPASGFHCVPPVDNDGTLAPVGTPGYFITINNDAWGGADELWIYQLVVNWTTPASSTFTRTQQLAVTPFDNNFGSGWNNIAQQGTAQKLDAVLEVLMQRPQYRNFGSYQTIVCCHTVDVNNTDRAGIRWYELRRTTGNWTIRQTGTYSPDAHSRWMGSIALNAYNEIGLGYSISSSTLYPGIRYCGQSATAYAAGAGVMDIAESTIHTGTASQTTSNRWGDYTMMSVDPSDNRTFWYTNQYHLNTNPNHPTRIASFSFDSYCTASGGCDEYIARVQAGTIDNMTGCTSYGNYTTMSTNLPLNATLHMTVTNGNTSYPSDQCGVWVDWNNDGDFYDGNETITVTGTPGVGPYTAAISPPAGTSVGAKRMRIRITYIGTVDPCGTTAYGEVEDYTINVTAESTSNTWLGVTSTDWHTGNNWSLGVPPTSTINATIPSGTPYSPVIQSGNAYCNNLIVNSGATLVQNSTSYFYVYGHFDPAFGQFTMNGATSYLYFSGTTNNYWYNDLGNDIYTQVRVAKSSPTSQTYMYSDMTCSGNFRIDGGILEMASNRTLTINNTTTSAFQVMSTGTLNLATGKTLTVAGGIIFQDGSQANITGGTINCGSNFRVNSNTSYNIALTGATLNLNGSVAQYIQDLDGGNLQLHHLTINKSAGTVYIANANLNINGNLLITSGILSCNNAPSPTATYNINIKGNWTNNVFPTGFVPGSGRVTFNGPGHQYVYSSENFNILEANMVAALRVNNAAYTVTCNQYDWTTGAIDVIAGTFTALDLADNGLYGAYYLNPGGTINITNSGTGTYVDLNGELHIFGGNMNVTGSICDWAYAGNAIIEMSGGVLDFKTCGIGIYESGYTLTSNITGGVIRTAYGFSGNRADFTPSAGSFEFYGTTDVYISQSNGSTLYNVNINKLAKGAKVNIPEIKTSEGRDGLMLAGGGKANSITQWSDFVITGNLDINNGTFSLGSYSCVVSGTTNIYGTLAMTDPSNDFDSYNINWNSGSNDNVTAGTFHAKNWAFNEGTNAKLGTGNTAYLYNLYYPTDDDAEFGNLVAVPFSKFIDGGEAGKALYPVRVAGDFTVQGTSWSFMNAATDLIVAGNSDIQAGSTIYFTNGADCITSGTLTLSGTMELSNGSSVMIHGGISFPTGGTLNISDASFVCYHPFIGGSGWTVYSGALNMSSGLFELTNNLPFFGSTASINVSGGILRTGGGIGAASSGIFQPTGGTVELCAGTEPYTAISCSPPNHFHDLLINRGTYESFNQVSDPIDVKNNLTIQTGSFKLHNLGGDLYIGGDWYNNVGYSGFNPYGNAVIFESTGDVQDVWGNTSFYNVTHNYTSAMNYLRFQDANTIQNDLVLNHFCWAYDQLDIIGILNINNPASKFTANGAVAVATIGTLDQGGTIICNGGATIQVNDLLEGGLYGNITLQSGTFNIYQDNQFIDLNANLTIESGVMNIYGSYGGSSIWPYTNNASITMSGGVLDIKELGVYVSPSYVLAVNITGGTIRTVGEFDVVRTDFTPAGGTIELYGGNDAWVRTAGGSHFYNLLINKSGGAKGFVKDKGGVDSDMADLQKEMTSLGGIQDAVPGKRPVTPELLSEANQVHNANVLKINNTTTVNAGTFFLTQYPVTCMGNIAVNSGGTLKLSENSLLAIEAGKSLTINSGGILDVDGTNTGPATFTHYSGNYALNVESGGTIGAVYGIFEYMNTSGVNVKSGALVDPLKPFNHCTFRLGQSGGRLLTINNNETFSVESAIFPTNTWGGSYNVYKSVNAGTVSFVTATGGFAGESYDYDPYNRIHWVNRQLSLKAYLEGPFSGGGMSTTLNPVLPLSHPFSPALPYFGNAMPDWYYTGAGSVAAIPNADIVDWVLIDVRDAVDAASATPATSIARFPAFIASNGAITDLTGGSKPELANSITHNLFVGIYHRNHVGIMNATPIPYASGVYDYDFSTGSAQVYGGTNAHKQLSTGAWGMMSGDGDGSGTVQTADKTNVWMIQAGTAGYKAGDYNMNRQVSNPDKDDKWLPNLGKGSYIPE